MADELEARDAALRTSDALRRQMFADVSHELKTPLTAMRGYIETLRMPEIARDGAIELRASVADGSAVLSVTDSGQGIAPEHVPHVFERFYKGDPARATETGGSGLGLSIAKAIVDRHGGTIRVESRPGCTIFTITLPL